MSIIFRRIKKIAPVLIVMLLLPVLYIAAHLGVNYFTNNVHTVVSGSIYRTAQLDDAGLTKYTKKFDLKTIIDLRGKWPLNHWYQVESHFAATHGVQYYPIEFSAYKLPTKQRLRELVQILLTAPKPLVFHCEGGADRTGMAAAISVILFDPNPSMNHIKRQASWHYNAISGDTVGYQVMRNYFAWLKQHHYISSKAHFLEWVNSPVKMKPYHGWFLV